MLWDTANSQWVKYNFLEEIHIALVDKALNAKFTSTDTIVISFMRPDAGVLCSGTEVQGQKPKCEK